MRVYLTGDRGSKTAFKITTAKVYTEFEPILEELMVEYDRDYDFENWIVDAWNLPIVYFGESDTGNRLKRMKVKDWLEAVEDYKKTNPDKYAKFLLIK